MYAYYCLHKFHWEPSKFVNLPLKEKVFIMAFIDERLAEEKKQQAKLKAKRRR